MELAYQLFDALNDFHNAGFVHGGLSVDSIMLSGEPQYLLLTDFGNATHLGCTAVEVLQRGHAQVSSKSDVYSAAAVLMHARSGKPACEAWRLVGLHESYSSGVNPLVDEVASSDLLPDFKDLLTRCLRINPRARPDASELLPELKCLMRDVHLDGDRLGALLQGLV